MDDAPKSASPISRMADERVDGWAALVLIALFVIGMVYWLETN